VPSLEEQPELLSSGEQYWEAFWALISTRPIGFGVGPIPFTAIVSYMNEIGLSDPDDREDMRKFVQFLDLRYLEYLQEKRDRESKSKGKAR
jgi:hypothetical protein